MNLEPDLGYDAMPKLSDADTTAVKEAIQGYLASISFADAMVGVGNASMHQDARIEPLSFYGPITVFTWVKRTPGANSPCGRGQAMSRLLSLRRE